MGVSQRAWMEHGVNIMHIYIPFVPFSQIPANLM
jgi:hypothetical protein